MTALELKPAQILGPHGKCRQVADSAVSADIVADTCPTWSVAD